MNVSNGLPRAFPPALIALLQPSQRLRRFGSLSGLANTLTIMSFGLLAIVVTLKITPRDDYPIEQTLRAAVKRPLVLIGADGQQFAERGECVAEPVKLAELPPHVVDAVLAMEDRRFYRHFGIDPKGIIRAAKRNYEAGSVRQGGSTITQQLVKISYLSSATTMQRKVEEALVALWLEMHLTKDQILERYLSSVYFGEGCFGLRAAARHFFDKPVGELNISEAALMVALLRSPTRLSNNLDDARIDASRVIRAMVQDGRLDAAKLVDLEPAWLDPGRGHEFGAYFADWLADGMQTEMSDRHSRKPIQVHTTFEPGLQRIAEKAVHGVLDKQGPKLNAGQAGLIAMRTDGRVVAMLGGKDWQTSQFNRAVQARRQPGSSFKTFVYLTAMQAGARPDMVMADEPIKIDGWEPKNFGGGYSGYLTLTQAYTASVNTVAVKLSEAVGRQAVIATAHNLGINSPLVANPSLPLGTSEVSLLEMTSAYAAIAAGAYPVKPWGVAGLDIRPAAGGGIPPKGSGAWKLAGAETMRELMASVVNFGSGRAARLPIPAYGKTGTSQEFRDAWFIGFAGNLVVGVWVGNDDDTPMRGVTGGSLPAQIWSAFMRDAMKADTRFEKKLPQIAAFEARPAAAVAPSLKLASLATYVAVQPVAPRKAAKRAGSFATEFRPRERDGPVTSRRAERREVRRDRDRREDRRERRERRNSQRSFFDSLFSMD
ncbi:MULTISPECIES: transglycosylase domain-containing protein [Rhodomicrobium]|uniref:transglycosylase domain-containing protein n=1 Tax=Rhodomicrobium TaxID=1068 RepID=UPI000B4BF6E1|nr:MULTISPECIES: transglycosylase domain-containing protein [Rhodomicrobium]